MSKIIGIYKITSLTGKIYIGQSVDIFKRFSGYKNLKCEDQPKLFNSLKKHGQENHKFEVVIECKKTELDSLEIFYINALDSIKNGLNCKSGGARGSISEESRKKLSNSLKITNKRPEVKERRSAWQIGRKMSDEFKKGQSLRKKGSKGHPNQIKSAKGNKHAQKDPITIFKNGLIVSVQENLYKAASFVNGDFRNVHACLSQKRKRHMGYTFKRTHESNIASVG